MQIDGSKNVPIYLQIVNECKEKILLGTLKPGDKMPSIRGLAKDLEVNPNTVKKSYHFLEREKILITDSTKGTFVSNNLESLLEGKINSYLETITLETKELKKMGVSLGTILERIEKKWKVL